jgi:hypothetical protein
MSPICRIVTKLAPSLVDGELPLLKVFDSHIKNCSNCSREFKEYSYLLGSLKQITKPLSVGSIIISSSEYQKAQQIGFKRRGLFYITSFSISGATAVGVVAYWLRRKRLAI